MTTTPYKGAILPLVAGDAGLWGAELNTGNFNVWDSALGAIVTKSLSNTNVTLSASESGSAIIRLTGTLLANVQITTGCQGFQFFENLTTGSFAVTLTNGVGSTLVLPQGYGVIVIMDTTNGVRAVNIVQGGPPSGTINPFAGSSAPSGWFLCYGQAISRTLYSSLFSTIGTTYGAGDGSTTFNLPDLRGRSIFGLDNMGGSAAGRLTGADSGNIATPTTLGSAGGEENHTLITGEMPVHNHGVTDPGHSHTITVNYIGEQHPGGAGWPNPSPSPQATSTSTTGITIQNAGGGASHNNIPPAMVMNWIIKT